MGRGSRDFRGESKDEEREIFCLGLFKPNSIYSATRFIVTKETFIREIEFLQSKRENLGIFWELTAKREG